MVQYYLENTALIHNIEYCTPRERIVCNQDKAIVLA